MNSLVPSGRSRLLMLMLRRSFLHRRTDNVMILIPSNDFNVNKFNNNLVFWQSRNSDINIDLEHRTMQTSKITDNCRSTSTTNLDCMSRFKEIRTQNFNNVIIGNLNINSLAFKFDELRLLVTGIFGILIITKTKLDKTFSLSQFHIDGFSTPYKLDRNRNGGGITIYIREYSQQNSNKTLFSKRPWSIFCWIKLI